MIITNRDLHSEMLRILVHANAKKILTETKIHTPYMYLVYGMYCKQNN